MKRLKPMALVIVLCFLVMAAGCGAAKDTNGVNWASPQTAPQEDYAGAAEQMGAEPSYGEGGMVAAPPYGDGSMGGSEQKIIRNAEYTLEVTDLDDVLAGLRMLVNKHNGIISSSSQGGQRGDIRYAYYTVRLPAAVYDAFLSELEKLGTVTDRSENASDITMKYVDLEARIRNAERQEERLLSILDKAETIEDILRVEQELARVRGQLESMIAEFRYLRDRVDYSTVNISIRETPVAGTAITGTGLKGVWQRGFAALVRSVNGMLVGLGNLMVFLFAAMPYLLLLALLLVPAVILKKRFGGGGVRPPRE